MTDTFERLKAALADRYTIEHELGAGGMAVVYLADDPKRELHPVLFRDAPLRVGTRDQRRQQRPDPAVSPKGPAHETPDAARLQPHLGKAQQSSRKRLGYRTPKEC